jgi:hypothetical protein
VFAHDGASWRSIYFVCGRDERLLCASRRQPKGAAESTIESLNSCPSQRCMMWSVCAMHCHVCLCKAATKWPAPFNLQSRKLVWGASSTCHYTWTPHHVHPRWQPTQQSRSRFASASFQASTHVALSRHHARPRESDAKRDGEQDLQTRVQHGLVLPHVVLTHGLKVSSGLASTVSDHGVCASV